jgi:RNA polymerase-binding transcription factor DksA
MDDAHDTDTDTDTGTGTGTGAGTDTDAASPAAAGEDYEVLIAVAERALDDVDRALERLDDHTYGTCERCGGPIGDELLRANPTTRTCTSHLPTASPGA